MLCACFLALHRRATIQRIECHPGRASRPSQRQAQVPAAAAAVPPQTAGGEPARCSARLAWLSGAGRQLWLGQTAPHTGGQAGPQALGLEQQRQQVRLDLLVRAVRAQSRQVA